MKQSTLSSARTIDASSGREGASLDNPERLSLAEAKHRALEGRLRELGRRVYLTPSEQIEVIDIKKQKLRAKDEIATLRRVTF